MNKHMPLTNQLDFLSGGGEMGERVRNFDWTKTPLGDPETWEQSLKTCVRIILTSAQPMFVWWGPSRINIYNDSYALIMGKKHPAGLGAKAENVWPEIWDLLVSRIESVKRNEGTYDDSFFFIMERKGFPEEVYLSFSYSPLPGDDGTIKGLFCVCTETTERIINERALQSLRDLGAVAFDERSLDVIYRNVAEVLGKNNKDFPFAVVYKVDKGGCSAVAAASTGISQYQVLFPQVIDAATPSVITGDFCKSYESNKVIVSGVKGMREELPKGFWKIPPSHFVYIPISAVGSKYPYAIILAALNPCRRFDASFQQFCKLIGARVSLEINKMHALEDERKRAESLEQIVKAKTVFFSSISHEFRTLLTLILSPLEELLHQPKSNLSAIEQHNIETAHRNALRLLKLVNTLLDFSRIVQLEEKRGTSGMYVEEAGTLLVKDNNTATTYASEGDNGPVILIVDDNADMREHLQSILLHHFNVVTANNGQEALLKIQEQKPTLIVSDVLMPVMDGIELVKAVKANKATAHIPVILLTARAGEESKIVGWETGADDYLTKPFSSKELVSRIASQIKTQQIRTEALVDMAEQRKYSRKLEDMNRELIKMNEELTSFAYVSSHDLQEPLRKIQMFSKRILEKEMNSLSDEGKNFFLRMDNAANRMQLLINDLLTYSRTNTSQKQFEKTSLNDLIRDVKQELYEKIMATNTIIECEPLPELYIIPFQFKQLFTNLLANSIKFAKPGERPHIIITCSLIGGSQIDFPTADKEKKYWHIAFADKGTGFDPHYNEQIFGLFQRLHGRKEFEGTGIGLAIAKKVVDNHNGIITAEGKDDEGATIHIYLPE